jgi:cobalt-zinc-cadmium efflux system protein
MKGPCDPETGYGCEAIGSPRVHSHTHGHDGHQHGRDADRRRLLLAMGLSGAILVAELIGGLVSGSLALLSDAGHVLTDMSAQIVSLLALVFAARPATPRKSFGYYRLEILAAMANGIILVGLAAGVGWAAYQRLRAGGSHPIHADIMVPVAVAGFLANVAGAWLLRGAHSLNVRGAYLHVLSDLLSSAAVTIGGVIIMFAPRATIIDPILGLAIAVFVLVGAFRLLREATDVLLEAVPAGIDLEKVREAVQGVPGIANVHDLHIWTITSGLHALSAHLVVQDGTASTDDLLVRVKDLLAREHAIAHSTLQIETPAYGRSHAD